MIANTINLVSSFEAMATVNEWLISYVGDRFLADNQPWLDAGADVWQVKILFLVSGAAEEVGVAAVDALTGELCARPAISALKRRALAIYQQRHDADPTPLSAARD